MASLSIGTKYANVLGSGLASWKVKYGVGETVDAAYYSLGPLTDGKVVVRSLTAPNEYGHQKPYADEIEVSAKMLCTNKTTVLELLGTLAGRQLAHKLTAINGKTFSFNAGVKWKFDSSADYNGYRFIEFTAKKRFLLAHASLVDWNDVIDTPSADGSPTGTDALYSWSATEYHPAGIYTLFLNPAGDDETIGKFRNAKFMAETLCAEDETGGYVPHAIKIDFSAEMLQTSSEYAYIDNQLASTDKAIVTLADNTAMTLTSSTGISWDYHLEGGAGSISYIALSGGGIVKLSDWAGIVS